MPRNRLASWREPFLAGRTQTPYREQANRRNCSPERVKAKPMASAADGFRSAVLSVDRAAAESILREGGSDWLEEVMYPALERIGADWERGDLALSQVYTAGRICEALVSRLLPELHNKEVAPARAAIVVLEDHHMLGKRIVQAAIRASGMSILDDGQLDADALVQRARTDGIRILLISTLMLPSALAVKGVKDQLGDDVKIIVRGAPSASTISFGKKWAPMPWDATRRMRSMFCARSSRRYHDFAFRAPVGRCASRVCGEVRNRQGWSWRRIHSRRQPRRDSVPGPYGARHRQAERR